MLKNLGKYMFMIELGANYINRFKKTFFHPFITLKPAYQELSLQRQNYSNQVLEFLNIEVEIFGKLPDENRILYVINHRSLLDIIVIENVLFTKHKNGTWIAKQELFDSLIYGKFFKYSGCISVDLENKRGLLTFFKTIKKTLFQVDDMNIYIFPEGERHKGNGIQSFQSGAQKIAKANKLKIVPIVICGKMEEVFKNAPYTQTKKVKVHIGDTITYDNLEDDYKTFYKSTEERYK